MTVQSKTVVKSYFVRGARPTEAQFIDLIDSYQDVGATDATLNNIIATSAAGVAIKNSSSTTVATFGATSNNANFLGNISVSGTVNTNNIQTTGSSGVVVKNSGGTTVMTIGPTNTTNVSIAGGLTLGGTLSGASLTAGTTPYSALASTAIATLSEIVSSTASKLVDAVGLTTYVSDWQNYTPTLSVGTGAVSNTTVNGAYRRVGDSIEARGVILFSAASSAFTDLVVSLPSGLTIDTTKINSLGAGFIPIGEVTFTDAGTATYFGSVGYNASSNVLLIASVSSTTYTSASAITNLIPFTYGANDVIHFKFKVPISGW